MRAGLKIKQPDLVTTFPTSGSDEFKPERLKPKVHSEHFSPLGWTRRTRRMSRKAILLLIRWKTYRIARKNNASVCPKNAHHNCCSDRDEGKTVAIGDSR